MDVAGRESGIGQWNEQYCSWIPLLCTLLSCYVMNNGDMALEALLQLDTIRLETDD